MHKVILLKIILTLLLQSKTAFAIDKIRYECETSGEVLSNVFGHYGPLCNGENDCKDASDEKFCEGETFTGCWSVSNHGTLASITSCSKCICTADVSDCSSQDFVDQDCHLCLTDETLLNDGINDCVNGIDETDDAKALKGRGANWRAVVKKGDWRCPDARNAVKKCGAVLKERRRPFLFAFPRATETSTACDDLGLQFYRCSDGRCVREQRHCLNEVPSDFPCLSSQWNCEGNCVDRKTPCDGRCYFTSNYFCRDFGQCIPMDQPCGFAKTCPADFTLCPDTDQCLSRDRYCRPSTNACPGDSRLCPLTGKCQPLTSPCGEECLSSTHEFCLTSRTCLPAHVPCGDLRCPDGQFSCQGRCQPARLPCSGACPSSYYLCVGKTFDSECISLQEKCLGKCKSGFKSCSGMPQDICQPESFCQDDIHEEADYEDKTSLPSNCKLQVCPVLPCKNPPCRENCIGLDESCHGLCLPGRFFCRGFCLTRAEYDVTCRAHASRLQATLLQVGVGVAVLAFVGGILVVAYRVCVIGKKNKKVEEEEVKLEKNDNSGFDVEGQAETEVDVHAEGAEPEMENSRTF